MKIIYLLMLSALITISATTQAQQTVKILSYNILEGMVRDSTENKKEFSNWIKEHNPDIVALQETNKFTQASLEALARSYDHPYAVLLKENGYPVALTSKWPIVNVSKVTDNMHHGFIKAKINGYNIIVTHFSPHKYLKRREEVATILETIKADGDKKNWILLGDLNSQSPLDKKKYINGKLVARLMENAKKYPKHDNLIDKKYLDFEVQQKILDAGFVDAFHLKSPKDSSFSRIDYIYTSPDLKPKIKVAYFIMDSFTKTHSDHRPLYVELKK